ncbi:hypothetical protein IQ274_28820 [Nostoc sp. LEGE 12447]|uniref:hypothetical protein n=1 Tax=Nostoc sp. LEGE 12447 TaxID=1828640 RepID=UPI0018840F34|nr:hypothetical protein [Nostoc sp. LEGE 12447]MBE9002098.1 hypothetical protein [Nostoc sp. LEGE 12447]
MNFNYRHRVNIFEPQTIRQNNLHHSQVLSPLLTFARIAQISIERSLILVP